MLLLAGRHPAEDNENRPLTQDKNGIRAVALDYRCERFRGFA